MTPLVLDAKGEKRRGARKERQEKQRRFEKVARAERYFARQLRQVAKQIGTLVDALAPDGRVESLPGLTQAMERYSDLLTPWAKAVAAKSVEEVARRDVSAWGDLGKEIGRNLRREIESAKTGEVMKREVDQRVDLIKSLPREASRRVHKLVIEGMSSGVRAKETAKEIARTGAVTKSRAMLIARTETTSAATAFVEARARYIGSTGYVWRTAHDADVRASHRAMEGRFVSWDEPPTLDGMTGHAGQFPNCRCAPEPVLPEVIE